MISVSRKPTATVPSRRLLAPLQHHFVLAIAPSQTTEAVKLFSITTLASVLFKEEQSFHESRLGLEVDVMLLHPSHPPPPRSLCTN